MQQIGFLLQNLWFSQHVSGTTMPIIRSKLHGTQYTHYNLKHMLPQHRKTYNDVFLLINSAKV